MSESETRAFHLAHRPRTVIVADSNEAAGASLRRTLESLPWNVIDVASPAAAVHAAHKNEHFGCIVLARFAPDDPDPERLARRLAAFSRGSNYLIYLTDDREPPTVSRAFAAGADDVLVQPVSDVELRARLDHAWRYLELELLREQVGDNRALIAEMSTATVVHSRNYLESELAKEVERSRRYGHALGVILAEASLEYGPAEGALRASGRYLLDLVRKDIDWVARYSQRSFAMVLPETGVQDTCTAAKRLAKQIRAADLKAAGIPKDTTWSFGVSGFDKVFGPDTPNAEALLSRAEEYLSSVRHKASDNVAGGNVMLRAN